MMQVIIGLATKEWEFVSQMRQKMSEAAVRAEAKNVCGSRAGRKGQSFDRVRLFKLQPW